MAVQGMGLDCRAGQSLPFMGEQARLIAAVNMPPDTKIPVMILRVPLGVYLPAGVSLQFGNDAAKAVPFEAVTAMAAQRHTL
jgi:invasion protein IalB